MNPSRESMEPASCHSHLSSLQVVCSRSQLGVADSYVASEPIWASVDLDPFGVYNIVFSLNVGSSERSNAVVFLFDVDGDDDQPRNAWGSLSPNFGSWRYRYLPSIDGEGFTAFKVTGPASGRIRIGLCTFRNREPVECCARVAVERLAEQVLIAMSTTEIALLQNSLSKLAPTDIYLEFGAGGSTALAASLGVGTFSVESDPKWIAKLRANNAIIQAERRGRLHFHHADIGPTSLFGHPSEGNAAALWPRYYLEIWGKLPQLPQLILIDGRFRLACAVTSMIAAPDALVAIHDVGKPGAQRTNYRRILEIADHIDCAESLLIVRRKSNVSQARALALLAVGANDTG